jgi:hypothetical protein
MSATVRYPNRRWQRMKNGVTWVRWHGLGWWSQQLRVANSNGVPPTWPIRPYVRLWSSKNLRIAILLPYRDK